MSTKEALMINNKVQMILKKNKTKYYEVYYDLAKAYDTVNHEWLLAVLKSYKVNSKLIRILENIIKRWNIDLYYNDNKIIKIHLQNGILQGDTMLPLLFIISINPILDKLDEIIEGVEIKKREQNI